MPALRSKINPRSDAFAANAQRMGVSGVPFFIVDGKYAISGAQGVDVFVKALKQIAGMNAGAA